MDDRLLKLFWSAIVACLFSTLTIHAQDNQRHRFPTSRRRLPTAIITREHLRQQQRSPTLYGPIGDTAAEFIVSAGLDTSKSSAVRIRKLGNRQDNASANEVSRKHLTVNFNGPHHRPQPDVRPHSQIDGHVVGHEQAFTGGHDQRFQPGRYQQRVHVRPSHDQLHSVISSGGTNQRIQPQLHPQQIHRRQDENNGRNRVPGYQQRFYPTVDVSVNGGPQQYIPPIFVPRYQQQNRDGQSNLNRPAGSLDVRTKDNSGEGWKTVVNSDSKPPLKPGITIDSNAYKTTHFFGSEEKIKTNLRDRQDTAQNTNGDELKEGGKKPQPVHKHVVAETPVLRLKPEDVKNYLIRRPSLVLTDQITVNEVSETSEKPRYGPRALQHDEESPTRPRLKRQVRNLYSLAHLELKRTSGMKNSSDELSEAKKLNSSHSQNETEILPKPLKVFGNLRNRGQRYGKQYPIRHHVEIKESKVQQSNLSHNSASLFDMKTPYYSDEYVSDESSKSSAESGGDREDVMSFSDFLASPIAEKIRLERQRMFRNTSQWNDPGYLNSTMESVIQNASVPLLRELIAARLLHGILNLNSSSASNNVTAPDTDRTTSRSSPDSLSSAEQRQFGIVVSPYDSVETLGTKSTMPVIRILRGKLVPLPDLPQELIPILMGTYRPTHMSETSIDDPKLTENILDNAILSLLQNEEAMGGGRPMVNRKMRPNNVSRFNRKSPSTNYVGSLKASEPQQVRTKYSFNQPSNEWSLGPRCDRLTEEICLDDSDYPSSAIMSSIYKDKLKFDLMYAEVKTRESQVEGLSRQQEQAYSFDHYYGSQSMSGSNLDPRDYGPNGGFVCPSEVHYGRPHRAKNRRGEWKVVVNVGEYTQTIRMEKCLGSGNPCKYVVAHMQSTCSQVYSYHRLLVFSKESGLHVDLFRVPTGCACHLRSGQQQAHHQSTYSEPVPYVVHRPGQYEEYGGHVETAPAPQSVSEGSSSGDNRPPSSFGSTLWAILGGGGQAGALAQHPQFQDEVQKQIGWAQSPHLLKQISPNQVLKQLLDMDDDEDYNIRRLRVRTKPSEQSNNGAYASHHIPISVPVPPRGVIARRPVVGSAPQDMFGRPAGPPKVIKIASNSDQPKIFSLTKDGAGSGVRIAEVAQHNGRGPTESKPSDQQESSSTFHQVKAYKIRPGMYHPPPTPADPLQFSEASHLPSLFSGGPRPVLRPMKNSDRIVEDADLIAIEKSEDGEIHAFKVEGMTTDSSSSEEDEDEEGKVNFSYHPILEYLNL